MQQASLSPHGLLRRRMVMALPLLGGAVWGGGASAGARVVSERSSRPLMGTQVDMAVEGVDGPQLRRAMDRAYAEMQRLEALMSHYQPRSVVSRINLAAGVTPVMVPAEVMAVLQGAAGLRRSGSMALELAYLAAGRVDVFWSHDMGSWDAAAGMLLIREAGGEVFTLDSLVWHASRRIAAATPAVANAWRELIRPRER